ncbi:ubiquitin carboxyl-terminal hydrolase 30 homolog [Argiope bruennichi]|uniref:Ubiquitin carboxyl-terminal hydrolase n=1 Tax=Argiope bruennichi TaxID=94029 RepID=A0A8T0FMM6_ARGBR|nr:ubiquitin carboxyl-terminal hydrolase 30 homolog [Argiope bruennichi]KAF8792166.1 Ubiquitin carboxyl-terminal hydrolase 30 like protein [Argiope bruennichi]
MTYWLYISAAAAIAIAGTYILWGPSNRPKQKKKNSVPGLLNLGNSCFLNAVLQALASCSSCTSWLLKAVEYAEEQQNKDCFLIKSVLAVLSALNRSDDNCSGAEVIKALRSHRWIISHEEHDAHELFHVLTTTVEEELVALNPVTSLLDTKKLENENSDLSSEPQKTFVSTPKTLPVRLAFPMRGLLVNELKCNSCNFKHPARYDSFDSITLTIPTPNNGKLTLHDLLLKFISCELIQDVVCETCPKSDPPADNGDQTVKTTFTQQVSFGKLPECLCIHIQRTVWLKNGLSVKCHDKVSFPEVLIMDYFVHSHSQKDKQLGASYSRLRLTGGNSSKSSQSSASIHPPSEATAKLSTDLSGSLKNVFPLNLSNKELMSSYKYMYLLKAVIVHLGGVSSGHFITYRRVGANKQNEKWFYTSDLEVKEVPFSEVSAACAYMLFYEKMR